MEQHADDQLAEAPETESASVHEIRPVENLKICPACLVSNSADDAFCTACGAALEPAAEAPTEIRDAWPTEAEVTAVQSPLPAPAVPSATATVPAARRGSRRLTAALLVCAAGLVAFAVLWQMQMSHAHSLSHTLARTESKLTSTSVQLRRTQAKLSSATALSEKRRFVLLQAKDVLGKVDPLLSSVDTIQNKAGAVGDQGSTLTSDAETFISTVADLVNYMLNTNASYYDYGYINQGIDNANSELDTIRADEAVFASNTSAYGGASDAFSGKASAFTKSVRLLQKQLNEAASK